MRAILEEKTSRIMEVHAFNSQRQGTDGRKILGVGAVGVDTW